MKATLSSARKVPFSGKISALIKGDDRYYILLHKFHGMNDPKLTETLKRIRAAGEIDLRYWRVASKGEKWV